jgi:hypothetical protein
MVFEPRKEFINMQLLVIGNIPILYFIIETDHTLCTPRWGSLFFPSVPP